MVKAQFYAKIQGRVEGYLTWGTLTPQSRKPCKKHMVNFVLTNEEGRDWLQFRSEISSARAGTASMLSVAAIAAKTLGVNTVAEEMVEERSGRWESRW